MKISSNMHFRRSSFSDIVSFRYDLVFLIIFCFCFKMNRYYLPKLMVINFHCQKTSFLNKSSLFLLLMRNIRNKIEMLKQKHFMKVFHVSWKAVNTKVFRISWNTHQEKFDSVSLPLESTLYRINMTMRFWEELTHIPVWVIESSKIKNWVFKLIKIILLWCFTS